MLSMEKNLQRYKTCLIHRDQVKTHAEDDKCEICGSDLHDVHYVNMAGSGKTQYFVEGEVLQRLTERNNWDGQPVFVINWDDGRAQWSNCKSLDMLVEVA